MHDGKLGINFRPTAGNRESDLYRTIFIPFEDLCPIEMPDGILTLVYSDHEEAQEPTPPAAQPEPPIRSELPLPYHVKHFHFLERLRPNPEWGYYIDHVPTVRTLDEYIAYELADGYVVNDIIPILDSDGLRVVTRYNPTVAVHHPGYDVAVDWVFDRIESLHGLEAAEGWKDGRKFASWSIR